MPTYTCGRCGYDTLNLSNFRKHCDKPRACAATVADIPCDFHAFARDAQKVTRFPCPYCDKYLASASTRCTHKKICKEKPSDETRASSSTSVGAVTVDGNVNITFDGTAVDNLARRVVELEARVHVLTSDAFELNEDGFVYLIWPAEFWERRENVFKVGMSGKDDPHGRLKKFSGCFQKHVCAEPPWVGIFSGLPQRDAHGDEPCH